MDGWDGGLWGLVLILGEVDLFDCERRGEVREGRRIKTRRGCWGWWCTYIGEIQYLWLEYFTSRILLAGFTSELVCVD